MTLVMCVYVLENHENTESVQNNRSKTVKEIASENGMLILESDRSNLQIHLQCITFVTCQCIVPKMLSPNHSTGNNMVKMKVL